MAVALTKAVVNPASGVYLTTRSFPTTNGKKVPILPVDEYASFEWIVNWPYSWNPTLVPSWIILTWSYSTLPSLPSTLTNSFADLCPETVVPIPASVNTVPAAPPATDTHVDWILTRDPFNPSEVVGSYGSAGMDVVAVATLVVDTPN